MYTLRWCEKKDWGFFVKLHEQAFKERVVELWGEWDAPKQKEFARREFEATDLAGQFVVCMKEEAIGYTSYKMSEGEITIVNVLLMPEWRGKGIGTQLLKDFQDMALRRERRLKLRTFVNNPAKELYMRLGFKVIDKNDKHVVMEWGPAVAGNR